MKGRLAREFPESHEIIIGGKGAVGTRGKRGVAAAAVGVILPNARTNGSATSAKHHLRDCLIKAFSRSLSEKGLQGLRNQLNLNVVQLRLKGECWKSCRRRVQA